VHPAKEQGVGQDLPRMGRKIHDNDEILSGVFPDVQSKPGLITMTQDDPRGP